MGSKRRSGALSPDLVCGGQGDAREAVEIGEMVAATKDGRCGIAKGTKRGRGCFGKYGEESERGWLRWRS